MPTSAFSTVTSKADVAAAIREVESVTSAEVVVAVRPSSGHYRHTDYLVGFVASFAALLVFLFDPHEFSILWMPLDTLVIFALGAWLSASVPPVRRALTSRKLMRQSVRTSARATFVDLGVSRTTGRTGMLVYVSMLERRIEVVLDSALDRAVLGPEFSRAVDALELAVRRGANFPGSWGRSARWGRFWLARSPASRGT